MCVKKNASDYALEFPLASQAVKESFYVDDGLTGAETIATLHPYKAPGKTYV